MKDSILRFVYLLFLACINEGFHVEALQNIGTVAGTIRLNGDTSRPLITIDQFVQPRCRILGSTFLRSNKSENESEIIYIDEVGSSSDDAILEDIREDMYAGQPSEITIMKDLLGINIFTYLLAAAITFFFSMNILLGPGWLGNSIGLQGTGTFEKVSDSLPDTMDLSNDDYLI